MMRPPSQGTRALRLVLDGRLVEHARVRLAGRTAWLNAAQVAIRWGAQLDVGEDVLGWRDARTSRTVVFHQGVARAHLEGGGEVDLSGPPRWSDGKLVLPADAVALAGSARWAVDGRLGVLFLTRPDPYLQGVRVLVDPSHGGADPGAALADGMPEKQANLAVARCLAHVLRAAGATAGLTRARDRTLTAIQRCGLARRFQAAVVVSVHHGVPGGQASAGVEAYYARRADSRRLAATLAAAVARELGLPGRGVREANLGLLGCLSCAAALVQTTRDSPPGDWGSLREALALFGGLRSFCSGARDGTLNALDPPL